MLVTSLALLPVLSCSSLSVLRSVMSTDGRFIVTFEKVTFEKADVCEEALVASWADGVEDP